MRHAADALIRADSITRGCSGNAVGDAQCFGVGKAQYKWVTWLALSVGGVTLVLEAVGGERGSNDLCRTRDRKSVV